MLEKNVYIPGSEKGGFLQRSLDFLGYAHLHINLTKYLSYAISISIQSGTFLVLVYDIRQQTL